MSVEEQARQNKKKENEKEKRDKESMPGGVGCRVFIDKGRVTQHAIMTRTMFSSWIALVQPWIHTVQSYLITVVITVVHPDTWLQAHPPSLSLVQAPLSTFQSSDYVPKLRNPLSIKKLKVGVQIIHRESWWCNLR